MADVERWPEWTASVKRVERLDEGPLRVGSRVRIRQPRLPLAVWTVTALEPGRFFEWRSPVPGLLSVGDHRVDAAGADTSRVTLSITWSGVLSPVIGLQSMRSRSASLHCARGRFPFPLGKDQGWGIGFASE